jgi:hypothetical protein
VALVVVLVVLVVLVVALVVALAAPAEREVAMVPLGENGRLAVQEAVAAVVLNEIVLKEEAPAVPKVDHRRKVHQRDPTPSGC